MILGISGKFSSGKSTVANLFAKHLRGKYPNILQKSFAFKLKKMVELLSGIQMKQSYSDNYFDNGIIDFTAEDKSIFIKEFNMTVGQMLQKIGTEVFRDNFSDEVWILTLLIDYDIYEKQNSLWIISDVRFTNEMKAIKNLNGLMIRTNRTDIEENINSNRDRSHVSETALDLRTDFDYVIDNSGSLEDLEQQIQQICTKIIFS